MRHLLYLTLPIILFSQDIQFREKDIESVIFRTTTAVTADLIDNNSLSFNEAKEKFDSINMEFEEEKSLFKSQILKLSINASYLHRSIKERESEIETLKTSIDRKESKLKQLESDIESEKRFISELQKLANRQIEFNSNISVQGYLLTFVENRRSVSRDVFVKSATESISTEAIRELNGILVETISKYDRELSMEVRETSSGTAIPDNSETTIKLFFSKDRKNSVLIYGTKVDVYPFENGEVIAKRGNDLDRSIKLTTLVMNKMDIGRVINEIEREYPKLRIDGSISAKIDSALDSIDKHNTISKETIIDIDNNHKDFQKKMVKRLKAREDVLKVLNEHRRLVGEEIAELTVDLLSAERDREMLGDKFQLVQSEIVNLKRELRFTKAEMYDRKHSNAVRETKDIVKELLLDIDNSLIKTSKMMETLFNGSVILKDVADEVEYDKLYLQSTIIPYFVDNTDKTGALVTLEIQFKDKKLPQLSPVEDMKFVKIPKGKFKFGSDSGDSDEKPVRELYIEKDFMIGKYEVSVAEYMEFAQETKSHYPEWYKVQNSSYRDSCLGDNCPIVGISWEDAVAYTDWLSKRDGKKYRLPTEFEWEYVSKVDLNRDFGFLYGELNDYSWYEKTSNGKAHRVGLKKPNLFGVYDMQGNVWEFCSDSYHYNYMDKREDPYKVMRGGDWRTKEYYLRSSNRAKYRKDRKSNGVGFRVVKELE
jgi:formylglycine-generating enzyme required for sulfatase activity